jgi:hypothetical protein
MARRIRIAVGERRRRGAVVEHHQRASQPIAAGGAADDLAAEAGDEEIFPDPMSRQAGALYLASPKALERTHLVEPVAQ